MRSRCVNLRRTLRRHVDEVSVTSIIHLWWKHSSLQFRLGNYSKLSLREYESIREGRINTRQQISAKWQEKSLKTIKRLFSVHGDLYVNIQIKIATLFEQIDRGYPREIWSSTQIKHDWLLKISISCVKSKVMIVWNSHYGDMENGARGTLTSYAPILTFFSALWESARHWISD